MNVDISVGDDHAMPMTKITATIIFTFAALLSSACQTSDAPATKPMPALSAEEENQLLTEMGIVGYSGNVVFVHGCQSRSIGLVFQRRDVLVVISQHPNASLSRRLKAICVFSK